MKNKIPVSCFAALALLLACLPARAVDSVSVEAGGGDGVDVVRAGAPWDWERKWFDNGSWRLRGYWGAQNGPWPAAAPGNGGRTWLANGSWHLGGYWDAQIGHWHGASGIPALSPTPTFRSQQASKRGASLEGAIGLHYISSRNVTATRQPGSNLTF